MRRRRIVVMKKMIQIRFIMAFTVLSTLHLLSHYYERRHCFHHFTDNDARNREVK